MDAKIDNTVLPSYFIFPDWLKEKNIKKTSDKMDVNQILKKRLSGNSIIEVVIAISIIAIGILVATLVYVSLNKSTTSMQEIKDQSEFQTKLFQQTMILDEKEIPEWKNYQTNISKIEVEKDCVHQIDYYLKK